jgi:hypothetical protein
VAPRASATPPWQDARRSRPCPSLPRRGRPCSMWRGAAQPPTLSAWRRSLSRMVALRCSARAPSDVA